MLLLQRNNWAFTFVQPRDRLNSMRNVLIAFLIPVKRKGRRRILIEEHVKAVIDFIDANPSAAVAEVIEHLIQQFDSLKVTNSTV